MDEAVASHACPKVPLSPPLLASSTVEHDITVERFFKLLFNWSV